MRSYRFARRSFLAGVGGAFGLEVMLRNLEAMADGASPPPRFLLTHFPVGTLRYRFLPSGSGSTYVASPITKPFEDAGLRNDMTVFFGFSDSHLACPGGGGHEAGTPFTTTGCSAQGTRQNGGEGDDGTGGGPSIDQVFLHNVTDLQRPGTGYANAICDARVDSNETGPQCLSYDYKTRSIASAVPGGNITEYTPLLPELYPAQLYTQLFSTYMPGGATAGNRDAMTKALKMRKSVLDFAMTELDQMKRLVPGAEAPKIEIHTDAIRKAEQALQTNPAMGCTVPTQPDKNLGGQKGNSQYLDKVSTDDAATHKAVAEAHMAILLAAFQCDIIRVATFQFSPGTNHVSFGGMWPSDAKRIAMHHPVSHHAAFLGGAAKRDPSTLTNQDDKDSYEFLANVQIWYNQRLAEFMVKLKTSQDAFGQNLLDRTLIPYITEVAESSHSRSPKPAFLFGGTKLGIKHGTVLNFEQQVRPQVDLYLTCAQALMQRDDVLTALASERFVGFNKGAAPFQGLWAKPV